MIDGWFYYDYEQCFRRIGSYAKSIGCDVLYYGENETSSHPHTCRILFNGTCICKIYYNDSDIFENYGSILDREIYSLKMLPDQYVPYNWFERLSTKFLNLFRKKTNYAKIIFITLAAVAAASAIAFVVYKLVKKYKEETVYDDLLEDCDFDCDCDFDDDAIEAAE